jgi:hypothetical protein
MDSNFDISLQRFRAAYQEWKNATVTFEQAVGRMCQGDLSAREEAQDCARELARLHHAFLEASQPCFARSQPAEPQASPDGGTNARSSMAPGDEAPAGTPGTGEAICRVCGGTGRIGERICAACDGVGKVNVAIGGA